MISKREIPWITLTLTALAVGFYGLVGPLESLVFTRTNPSLHTIVTSHLVHWSLDHLFYDALMFLLLGIWCERLNRKHYVLFLIVGAFSIPPLALALSPSIDQLAGLSGFTMGQAAFGVSVLAPRIKEMGPSMIIPIALVASATLGKLLFELLSGTNLYVNTDTFVSVPAAHLVGVVVGVLVGWNKQKPTMVFQR